MEKKAPLVSVVVPFFDEKENLEPLWREIREALDGAGLDGEILFVDDGSRDGSHRVVETLHEKDPSVRLVRLSRNFGHQAALSAGLDLARGEAVITLDADLQHPPSLIPEMVRIWREEGAAVVNTVRDSMEGAGPLKRGASKLFYSLWKRLAEVEISPGTADFRLLDRAVVDALKRLPERRRFLRGLVSWLGFPQKEIRYEAPARHSGKSKYSIRKMVRLAVDGITSFSAAPLQLSALLGAAVTSLAFLYMVYAFVQWARGAVQPGWSSLIAAVLLLGGVQLLALGVIGLYLGRVYNEVKARPVYVIQETRFFPEKEKSEEPARREDTEPGGEPAKTDPRG